MNRIIPTDSIHLTSSRTLSYYRSVNSFAVVVRYMEELGVEADTLLEGSGIHADDLEDPDILVTPEQELMVLRKIVSSAPDQRIGLLIGQQYHVGIHGKLGAALMSCDTVLDAVKFLFQYIDLVMTYFQYVLKEEGDIVIVRMKELIDLNDLRTFVCEKEFVSVYRIAGDIAGTPLPLRELRLAYPKPAYASFYEDVFQCPVHFNADEYMMTFDRGFLFRKLPMSDPLGRNIFEKECSQLADRIKIRKTVTDQVRHTIHLQSDVFPTLYQIAQSMNMSTRTLKRRLSREGTTYKALSADIRKTMAINLIQTTTFSMEQIAAELGYSDLANFYRAFKGWTGHNPSHYRKKNNDQPRKN